MTIILESFLLANDVLALQFSLPRLSNYSVYHKHCVISVSVFGVFLVHIFPNVFPINCTVKIKAFFILPRKTS